MRNAKYYEWLPAYLEDGLNEAQKAQMQARLAADPALALEAERLRHLLEGLRSSAARQTTPANAVVPADLRQRLLRRLEPAPAPRPRRQIGWMAGVGVTAALAGAAALWLPMGLPTKPSDHSEGGAKLAKTNPPVQTAQTSRKDRARPATPPASAVAGVVPRPLPHPVQVAQAQPPPLTFSNAGPFAAPTIPAQAPVAVYKASPAAPPLPLAPPAKPAVVGGITGKPTRMASRLDGQKNIHQDGDQAISENAPLPVSPPTLFAAPPPAPVMAQAAPSPAATFKAADPAMDNAGQMAAPMKIATVAQDEANASADSVSPSLPRTKTQASSSAAPRTESRVRRMAGVRKAAVPQAAYRAAIADGALMNGQSLDFWQASLSAAVQPPLWGENTGEQQANQALMAVREAGQWDTLRSRLESHREQSPQDIAGGRMLAAVYDFAGQGDLALRERRRIAGLPGAGGEDWFALAQIEERAGNRQAAKADYHRALESPLPPSSFHAALARQRQ